ADQLQTAVMLEPDLVIVHAGMNDLLLVRNDIDAMMARYADALKTLQQTGAHVLAFTAGDLGTVPLFRRLRGRAAVYNELLRAIADDLGLQLVDFWRFTEFRDPRLWAGDRIHLSPLGHERMAAKVLDTLTVSHNLPTRSAALLDSSSPARSFWANLQWALAFAAPWVAKRLRREPQDADRRWNVGDRRRRRRGRRRRSPHGRPHRSDAVAARRPQRRTTGGRAASAIRCRRCIRSGGVLAHRRRGEQSPSPGRHARRRRWPNRGRGDGDLSRRRLPHRDPGAPRPAHESRTRHRLRLRRGARRRQSRSGHRADGAARPLPAAVHQLWRSVHPDAGRPCRQRVR